MQSMNEELAWHIVVIATKAGSSLTSLVSDLKDSCSTEEFAYFAKAIGLVRADIGTEIVRALYKKFPHLEARLQSTLEVHGRL